MGLKIYNEYILTVATLLLITTVILVATGQDKLDIYYTLYIIETLIVTELYVYLNPKSRRGLNLVSLFLFCGFMVIVATKVIEILK